MQTHQLMSSRLVAVLACLLPGLGCEATSPGEPFDADSGSTGSAETGQGPTSGVSPGEVTTATSTTDAESVTSNGDVSAGSSDESTTETPATDTSADTDTGGTDTTSTSGGNQGDPVDLADYDAAGPVQTIPAPGTNASGIAWNHDTDRLWIVQNGAGAFFEYAVDDLSTPIRRIQLVGINASDTEGLVYMGGGEIAVAFEGGYGVYIADIPDGDVDVSTPVKQVLTLATPPMVGNNGLEGIAYDPEGEVFYAVGEGQADAAPRRFFRFERPQDTTTDLTWQDAGLDVTEPFDADAVLPGSGGSLDLAGIAFDSRDGNVLIVSHTGTAVIQLDPNGDGTILSELDLPPNQWEGVTLQGPNADLWVVGESNDVQRYVYGGQ